LPAQWRGSWGASGPGGTPEASTLHRLPAFAVKAELCSSGSFLDSAQLNFPCPSFSAGKESAQVLNRAGEVVPSILRLVPSTSRVPTSEFRCPDLGARRGPLDLPRSTL